MHLSQEPNSIHNTTSGIMALKQTASTKGQEHVEYEACHGLAAFQLGLPVITFDLLQTRVQLWTSRWALTM